MAYDDHAKLLAIKVIGTVESNLNYGSINYNDAITVGFMQWWGTRAANILFRIANENPSSWTGAPQSIKDSMSAHPSTDSWWESRYLSNSEGQALSPILIANTAIQNSQAISDLEPYKQAAINIGMDPENNTNSVIFFFVMWHQGPKYALQVMNSAGADASLDRIHSICLNNPTFSQYPNRYNTAYSMIASGDTSGMDNPTGSTNTSPGGDTGTTTQIKSTVTYIEGVGNNLLLHMQDKSKQWAYFDGRNRWIISSKPTNGTPIVVDPSTPTDPVTSQTMQNMIAWAKSVEYKYSYAQAPGRTEPDVSGYTDCSGFTRYAYLKFYGLNIGYDTLEQLANGSEIIGKTSGSLNESIMKPGDLILYDWDGGRVDHVEMYIGSGTIIGHPGPGMGPYEKPITWGSSAVWRTVRRYIN